MRWYIPVHFYRQPSQIYIKKNVQYLKTAFFIIKNKVRLKKCLNKISNMTKFYCPNKSIYYFFKFNTLISTSFRRSMLISFWIVVPGNHHKSIKEKMPRYGLKEVQYLKIAFFHNREIFWEMVWSKMFNV
jgi:hypothetical protein